MQHTIAWIDNSEGENIGREMSLEEIRQRLGGGATEADALLFSKLWNVRFLDCSPTFYDDADFDSTWAELLPWLG